jgi:hypothetical protein
MKQKKTNGVNPTPRVKCDVCKRVFSLDEAKPKVEDHGGELHVQEVYFNCPLCNKRYTAYVIDDYVKELQMRRDQSPSQDLRDRTHKKVVERMNALKKKYGR